MEDARAAALGRVAELKAQVRRDSASSAQLREEIGTSLAASDHAAASAEGAIALADTLTAVKGRLDAELAESSPEWRSRTDFEAANARMDVQTPVNQELHHSEQHWPAGETGPAQVRRRYTTRQKNASSHQNIIRPTDGTDGPRRPEASPPPFGTDADMSPEEGGRLRLLVDGGARCIDVRAKSTAAGTDTHKRPLSARNVLTGEGAVETHTASAHVSPAPRPSSAPVRTSHVIDASGLRTDQRRSLRRCGPEQDQPEKVSNRRGCTQEPVQRAEW